MTRFDAIVLAGGRASRLDGAPKPGLLLDGTRLLDLALAAVEHAQTIVAVGPKTLADGLTPRVLVTREDPPFGGPAAGIAAGLAALDRPDAPRLVALLAVDIPGAGRALPALLDRAAKAADDGTRAVDGAVLERDGHPQWLVSVVRRDRLVDAVETLCGREGSVHHQPVRRLLAPLRLLTVPDTDGASDDVDTWDDLARLTTAAREDTR